MLNPGQAEPGGLGNLIAQQPMQGTTSAGINPMTPMLSQLPVQQLMAELLNPNSTTPKFAVLSAIQKAQERMRMSQAMQGMAAQQAVAQQPGTVAQEILAAGIGSQPYEFAGGGLVAFADGGMAAEDIDTADLGDQMAFGLTPEFELGEPVETNESFLSRIIREARERRQREEEARKEAWLRENAPVAIQKRDTPPTPPTALQLALYAQRGAPPAAAGAGTRPGGAPAAEDQRSERNAPPDPTAAAIAEYLKQGQEAITGMEGRGKVPAGELELRKALLAAQEAERQTPMEYKEPSGLTGRELLQLASFDPTKGRWMGSLAERAAGVMGARETKAEEAKKANREIDVANRRLNTALAQQRLAYASTDRKAQEDADLAVANARVALREKVIDLRLKAQDTESRRITAEASRTAANQRAERPEIGPAQKAQILRDVTKSVDEDPQVIAQLARITDPAQKAQRREQIIQQRYEAQLARFMGTAPPTSTAPTTSTQGWGQATVVSKP